MIDIGDPAFERLARRPRLTQSAEAEAKKENRA